MTCLVIYILVSACIYFAVFAPATASDMASWIDLSASCHHDIENNHFQYESYNMVFFRQYYACTELCCADDFQTSYSVQRPFNYRFTLFKLMDIQLDRAAR